MTSKIIHIGAATLVALVFACTPPKVHKQEVFLEEGSWMMLVDIGKDVIPLRLNIHGDTAEFINSDERIPASIKHLGMDSVRVDMPVFGTYFSFKRWSPDSISGIYFDPGRGDYQIPFTATHQPAHLSGSSLTESIFDVTFSPDTTGSYPAIGIFRHSPNGYANGTFLTETGDYRYLEGKWAQGQLKLSGFDGSHLFMFTAQGSPGDTLHGQFYSGTHWNEPWIATPDPAATLSDPYSITTLVTAPGRWSFKVMDENMEEQLIEPAMLQGQVTVIQIFGSWCPNCMDETRFFQELRDQYAAEDLQIIPVAFERGEDPARWKQAVAQYKESLGIQYPIYLGGTAGKGHAAEVFSMLSGISSYPTTLIVDKSGQIRKIHTGFYGPGTGKYYLAYKEMTRNLLDSLIKEDHSNSLTLSTTIR